MKRPPASAPSSPRGRWSFYERCSNDSANPPAEGTRVTPDQAILLFEQADLLDLAETADRIRIGVIPTM